MTNYTTGTVTLTNGSRSVIGNGTGWETAIILGGVIYPEVFGNSLPISSVDSDTAITAATAWAGTSGTYPYAIVRQDDENSIIANQVALARYISQLDRPSLLALASLNPSADTVPYFTGSGTSALTSFSAFSRSLLAQASAQGMRDTIGALNRAGDTASGTILLESSRGSPNPGQYISSPQLQSKFSGAGFASFFHQEQAGLNNSAIISASDGGNIIAFLRFDRNGKLEVPGSLTAASKNFLIDHPLDPYNQDLVFASTESPHFGVEAWGLTRLVDGRATVDIDSASNLTSETWAALTQNTVVTSLQNQEGFTAVRPGPVSGGSFDIIAEDETCTDLIAWRVVADRADPVVKTLANADPNTGMLIPEQDKEELA